MPRPRLALRRRRVGKSLGPGVTSFCSPAPAAKMWRIRGRPSGSRRVKPTDRIEFPGAGGLVRGPGRGEAGGHQKFFFIFLPWRFFAFLPFYNFRFTNIVRTVRESWQRVFGFYCVFLFLCVRRVSIGGRRGARGDKRQRICPQRHKQGWGGWPALR